MIGNDDYREFLSAVATCKCSVMLSGDDRQLSSVGRGGMFKIFANRYFSSNTYNINRQSSKWSESVAMVGAILDSYSFYFILFYFISFSEGFPNSKYSRLLDTSHIS